MSAAGDLARRKPSSLVGSSIDVWGGPLRPAEFLCSSPYLAVPRHLSVIPASSPGHASEHYGGLVRAGGRPRLTDLVLVGAAAPGVEVIRVEAVVRGCGDPDAGAPDVHRLTWCP